MSKKKKQIRKAFRDAVFERDGYECVTCGRHAASGDDNVQSSVRDLLDAHHITPREEMPAGGYVKENGISLCKDKCHLMAEKYLQGNHDYGLFSPNKLYEYINSSKEDAVKASKHLEQSVL